MSEQFEATLATGRTSAIVVQFAEFKGERGLDIRKQYSGAPTKKGTFLVIGKGQADFVRNALPKVLEARGGEEVLDEGGSMNLVVKRFDYRKMEGYSIRKEAASGGWGKGIWLNLEQAQWVNEQIGNALAA